MDGRAAARIPAAPGNADRALPGAFGGLFRHAALGCRTPAGISEADRPPWHERSQPDAGTPDGQRTATVFFDAERDGAAVDPQWLAAFRAAGMHNLLGLNHRPGDPANPFMTAMAIYNGAARRRDTHRKPAAGTDAAAACALRRIQDSMSKSMMSAAAAKGRQPDDPGRRDPAPAVARQDQQGNRPAHRQEPRDRQEQDRPADHRFGVRNRTELVSVIASRLPAEAIPEFRPMAAAATQGPAQRARGGCPPSPTSPRARLAPSPAPPPPPPSRPAPSCRAWRP